MRNILFFLCIQLSAINSTLAQFPIKSPELTKTEIGFLYYVDQKHISFVSLKECKKNISLKDFKTENLNTALELNWKQLFVDTLKKYELKKKLKNFPYDNAYLTLIPVEVTYKINAYEKSRKQYKESYSLDYFEFEDSLVKISAFGGVPVNIITLESICKVLK